jgi:hypothetical protein
MRLNKIAFLIYCALLGNHFNVFASDKHNAGEYAAQLEIRQYRFSRHGGDHDRLVLEFDQKGSGSQNSPTVKVEKWEGESSLVKLHGAVLLGAIPESLINDSFARKSRFLGNVSLTMDAPESGFSLRVEHKRGGDQVKALWLQNPSRLVIDAYSSGHSADRQASSLQHSNPKRPGLDRLMCFPANSKVNLTVSFQAPAPSSDDIQNIRVNTDGTTLTPAPTPPADAVVCYPRKSFVTASLSFEETHRNAAFTQTPASETLFAPSAPPARPTAPLMPSVVKSAPVESDLDLDPASAELGQLPTSFGAPRAPAAAPKAVSPLSLLPKLNQ